jgi:AraC-like DNA-binding protein
VEQCALEATDGLDVEDAALALFEALPNVDILDALPGPRRRHAELVEATKELLLRRFDEPLSLDRLAHLVGASPFHLARLFRRRTGFSLHGYRTRVRLLHALDRAADFRGRLTDLALDLGFASQSHLTDAFRRTFGVPPGALASRGSLTRQAVRGSRQARADRAEVAPLPRAAKRTSHGARGLLL